MNDSYYIYRMVCRVLAGAFAVVALAMLFLPGFLAASIEFVSSFIGLAGEIRIGAADLDHVLSVSLMACLVVLALGSGRRPEQLPPYVALLAAKIVSTIGFVYLALTVGPAWTLPAVADGSVIAALVVARSLAAPDPGG